MNNSYITAYYYDEEELLEGIRQIKEKGVEILDVMTPFPVHGLDKAIGLRRSRLTRVAFWGGTIGALIGFLFQAWVFTQAYVINFGGKPFFAVPSFMPVTFEMAVLFSAFSMVLAFLIYFKLGPGAKPIIYDERSTDDRFLLIVKAGDADETKNIEKALSQAGAEGIKHKA
ncbi:MAG: DUF3341 domain-containing protein [Bacteroidetes bacterium]|nr:DUF3341 domain-containing protein [Bacteroidota bacterium]MBU1579362.1 DUF3341 domain-containing protein [Bacteroidota bacterium]MBU2466973.1 DUF3341 domain-containing protein [Bacteroidota bacterium]MBU2558862.1 DUF3341 domain-containing protein [Bacteroidota bacterium]